MDIRNLSFWTNDETFRDPPHTILSGNISVVPTGRIGNTIILEVLEGVLCLVILNIDPEKYDIPIFCFSSRQLSVLLLRLCKGYTKKPRN